MRDPSSHAPTSPLIAHQADSRLRIALTMSALIAIAVAVMIAFTT